MADVSKIMVISHCCMAKPNTTYMCAKSLQSSLTFCDPVDCDLPGSSVHGILHARILEWVVSPSSRGSSQPRDQTCMSYVS